MEITASNYKITASKKEITASNYKITGGNYEIDGIKKKINAINYKINGINFIINAINLSSGLIPYARWCAKRVLDLGDEICCGYILRQEALLESVNLDKTCCCKQKHSYACSFHHLTRTPWRPASQLHYPSCALGERTPLGERASSPAHKEGHKHTILSVTFCVPAKPGSVVAPPGAKCPTSSTRLPHQRASPYTKRVSSPIFALNLPLISDTNIWYNAHRQRRQRPSHRHAGKFPALGGA